MKKLFSLLILLASVFLTINASAQSANTSLSNLASATQVNHSLTPGTTNTLSLGTGTIGWRNLYLTNGLYIDNHRFLNNSGTGNNFIGTDAGKSITTGYQNTGAGYNALYNNSTGSYNTANGYNALYSNTTGSSNTVNGAFALYSNTTATDNTANGASALYFNTTGSDNTAIGHLTLYFNTTGGDNIAVGEQALLHNTTGYSNTATGYQALAYNTTGTDNTAMGLSALLSITTGVGNTGFGEFSLANTTGASYNTAIGYNAGNGGDNGYNNVFIGANTGVNSDGYFNVIAIGQGTVSTASSQVTMGNGATNSYRAYANWSNISDGRVKRNIKQNVPGLAFINKLQPITYNLNLDAIDNIIQAPRKDSTGKVIPLSNDEITARKAKEQIVYTGFVAQDVEKAAKSLDYDFSGVDAAKNAKDVYGLRYAEFVVPLVKAVQELSKQNDSLKSKNNDLEARLTKLETMMNVNLSTVNSQLSTVSSASLQQNIPNPFTNSTSISYTLPQTYSSAKIIITDNKGVALKQISLNTKGKSSINVDAATLASGAYYYSLYVDGKMIDSRQMISSR